MPSTPSRLSASVVPSPHQPGRKCGQSLPDVPGSDTAHLAESSAQVSMERTRRRPRRGQAQIAGRATRIMSRKRSSLPATRGTTELAAGTRRTWVRFDVDSYRRARERWRMAFKPTEAELALALHRIVDAASALFANVERLARAVRAGIEGDLVTGLSTAVPMRRAR